uniref:Uncharacterized protein n=1 Tax=Trichogramma kaykai TaxID=54128 RepID=A0ABD2XJS5_9HYME
MKKKIIKKQQKLLRIISPLSDRERRNIVNNFKALRARVDWTNEESRRKFLLDIHPKVIKTRWAGQYPELRGIFEPREIDYILWDSVNCHYESEHKYLGLQIIEFVALCGYKDEARTDGGWPPSSRRTTALHRAFESNTYHIAELLFKIYADRDVNYADETGLTHLHVACRFGCDEVVDKFLRHGQDPNLVWPATGDSLLHLAMRDQHTALVRKLLKRGADTHRANDEYKLPLHVACEKTALHLDLPIGDWCKLLWIGSGNKVAANLDARDKWGNTPLHLACFGENAKMIKLLMENGADPNSANEEGKTPLHVLCQRNHGRFDDVSTAAQLFNLAHQAKKVVLVDYLDNRGRTPLQLAVANFWPEMVVQLLDRGADLHRFSFPQVADFLERLKVYRDGWKRFALRLAWGLLSCVERLENAGWELGLTEVERIMRLFAEQGLFAESASLDERWYASWADTADKIGMAPKLSLLEVTRLRADEAEDWLTLDHFSRYLSPYRKIHLPEEADLTCARHLCEKMSRKFFRRWAREIQPYELVDDLMNKDLYDICCRMKWMANNVVKRKKKKWGRGVRNGLRSKKAIRL